MTALFSAYEAKSLNMSVVLGAFERLNIRQHCLWMWYYLLAC